MALYTGYFDEGASEYDRFFVMGGIVLDAEKSPEFDKEWLDAIKQLPVLKSSGQPFLHTTDFINGEKGFESWKGRYVEKAQILSNVAKVIARHSFRVFSCVLLMDHYRKINQNVQFSELMGEPYALLVRCAWEQLKAWKYRLNLNQPVMMTIEQRNGIGDVKEIFLNDKQQIPQTGGKETCALQAADYVAWMRQQRLIPCGGYSHVRHTWEHVGRALHEDYVVEIGMMRELCERIALPHGESVPARGEFPDKQVRLESNPKRRRPPYKPFAN